MLSRREFAAVPAVLAAAALTGFAQTAPLTAGQVVDRIKEHLGVPWRGGPTDTFKAGVADSANTAGQRKGMIIIGHWVSEDQGMRLTADWLKSFVPEVPVQWIPAGDPFWRP